MCRHLVTGRAISVLSHCLSGISSLALTYTTPDSGLTGYWTTRGYANSRIANSRTGQLADAIGDFPSLVFLFGGICETVSCPVRELAYVRVVQLPFNIHLFRHGKSIVSSVVK